MIEYRQEALCIQPLNSFKDERAVWPTDKTAGNPPKFRVAQYEMGNLFHWTVIIRDEKKAVVYTELMKE